MLWNFEAVFVTFCKLLFDKLLVILREREEEKERKRERERGGDSAKRGT